MLDFRNTNTLWASLLVETLVQLGATTVVISPGSRSTPLVVAAACHPQLQAIPILDERSASFFALGQAKASGRACVLICTSGTAGANYFPAVIEAAESQVPLLILTADRPAELRDCASGQTIDQQRLFGHYVRHFAELALPEATLPQLQYLRQVIAQAWRCCHYPVAGPVHLNCPFRDPLAPLEDGTTAAMRGAIAAPFFQHLTALEPVYSAPPMAAGWPEPLAGCDRTLIIAGPAQPTQPQAYCDAVARLASNLGWPVLADGLSPLRNHAQRNPYLITTYDLLLRHPHHATCLRPEQVLQLGPLPTSKILRQWLAETNPQRWILSQSGRNYDPLHGAAVHLPLSLPQLLAALPAPTATVTAYTRAWVRREAIARQRLQQAMQALPDDFEGKLSWRLPALLPRRLAVMIANSTPVRDVEWFWPANDQEIRPYFNRGANGIDGILSTALGLAHAHQRALLLTGDLALLHDSNGFLNAVQRQGHLTIVLINNQGGGIFESLPIAQFEPPFEKFFAMPQAVDFQSLAAAHGVTYACLTPGVELAQQLSQWPDSGVRLLEIRCDRQQDAHRRQTLLQTLGDFAP